MASPYSIHEIMQMIMDVVDFVVLRLIILLHILDSRFVGAILGLAVAIVFTCILLRSPSEPQRRRPKRQTPAPSNSSVANLTNPNHISSGLSSEVTSAQNVIDEFSQPVKPTLGQIVRQRLSEGRKVTCRLLGVILEESTPEEIQKKVTVRSSVLEVLLEITKFCDLYIMERVLDDESEKKVLAALEEAGIFTSGGIIKDKVLFCSTETGRISFVRQLEPDWHIDTNPEIIQQLSRFIRHQLYIASVKPERPTSKIVSSPSLEEFFGCV